MSSICPKCEYANLADSTFCGKCSAMLSPREALFANDEYRTLTVLFSDLSSWTHIIERFRDENARALLTEIKRAAIDIVERHDGVVNQFVGDEIMALFGLSGSVESAPLRCARAAHDLHEMVRKISRTMVETSADRPVRLHSGFATGSVLLYRDASDSRSGIYQATGNVVNLAHRMVELAERDTILCCADSHARIAEFYDFDCMSGIALKRFDGLYTVWVLKGPTANHERFAVETQSGLTPWTGRQQDLRTLQANLAEAIAGAGGCVVVAGHAGIGKTRLAYEFRRTIAPARCLSLIGNCQTARHEIAYLPILESLKSALALNVDLSSDELHELAVKAILELDRGMAVYLPHLLYLLAIPSARHAIDQKIPGDTLRAEFELALFAVLTGLARRQPLVLFYEDWHQADDASHAFMGRFIETLREYPILLVILTRPNVDQVWVESGNLTVMNLDPLSCDHTQEILKAVIRAGDLPLGLAELVYQRTEGNALFVEELARELLESGALVVTDGVARIDKSVDESTLPLSVQAAIESRVFTLEYFSRETLMTASVIGRTFDQDLLQAISPTPQVVPEALANLMERDLIYREDPRSTHEYRFKHVVVQEVAYRILTLKRRKDNHKNVARAIERLHEERLTEYFEQLAFHYREADIADKAIEYLGHAAQRSTGLVMIGQAMDQYRAALTMLDGSDLDDDKKRMRIAYSLKLGRLASAFPSPEVYTILLQSHRLAREIDDEQLQGRLALALGNVSWLDSRFIQAREHLSESMKVAAHSKDELTGAFAQANFGQSLFYSADFERGIEYLERAIEIAERLDNRGALHTAYNFLALQCFFTGQFERSAQLQSIILGSAIKHRDRLLEQIIRLWSSIRLSVQGEWQSAIALCDRAIEIGDATAAKYIEGYARCGKAYAQFMLRGGCAEALRDYESALDLLNGIGHKLALSLYEAAFAEMCALRGDGVRAAEHAQIALACEIRDEHLGEVMAARALAIAEASADTPDWDRVESHVARSLNLARQRGQRPDEAITRYRYGEILHKMGNRRAALRQLEQAENLFTAMKMDWWVNSAQTARRGMV